MHVKFMGYVQEDSILINVQIFCTAVFATFGSV
jgi:hypothetical protein